MVALSQLPSPDTQPLPISPPRFLPHLSPPRAQPTSRPGSDTFANMVPTHVDFRARALSFSQPKPAGTTAQDLLNGVLGLPSPTNDPAPAATPLFSGLGGLASSVWSPANDVRLPRHQRSVSTSLAQGTRQANGIPNGLGLITGLSPFVQSSGLPQSSQSSWPPTQLSQPHADITPYPPLDPIGHNRAHSSGVPPHLTSPNSMTGIISSSRTAQPIPGVPPNFGSIDLSGGLGGGYSNDSIAQQGVSSTSQQLSYNFPFGNSLGIQGGGWER